MTAPPEREWTESREYQAATRDETVWARVAGRGETLGIQVEPAAMSRDGRQLAQQIQACADAAFLEAQLDQRHTMQRHGVASEHYEWMASPAELEAARERLGRL
ncbi:hypothetical protein [Mycolicibacterium llatzerense]|uniref:hypothetical protein n=1 Tax=Mycolicibacterium llatzerense TaxID=280871 RepID=UPI0031D9BEE9